MTAVFLPITVIGWMNCLDDALSSRYIHDTQTMAKGAERQTILSMSRGIMLAMIDPPRLSYIHTVHSESGSEQGTDRAVRAHLRRFGRAKDHPDYLHMIDALEKAFPCFTEDYLRDIHATLQSHAIQTPTLKVQNS